MSEMQNIEMEQQLLGAMLVHNPVVYRICGKLKPHHFANQFHEEVYARIVEGVTIRNEKVTPVTLKNWVNGNETLKEILPADAPRYLAHLVATAVIVFDVEQFAEAIIRFWMLRQAHAAALTLMAQATTPDADPENVIGKFHAALLDIRSGGVASAMDSKALTEVMIEDLKNDLPIDSTGLPKLDLIMDGGLIQGKLYGFFARKKMGKTSFAVTLAHNLGKQNVKHAFICGEMGRKEIHERYLSRVIQVYPSSFRDKNYRNSKVFNDKILDARESMPRTTYYYDAAGMTFEDLKGMVSEAKYRYGCNGVILDYLQLVGGKPSRMSEASHLDAVSQWLAEAAKKYNIWILALGQINQEGNTRGGEGIRLACDMCLELHRDNLGKPEAWIEMKDTRYTKWMNLGEEGFPALTMNPHGQYFEEIINQI